MPRKILAVIHVNNGSIVSRSPESVRYDTGTGVVSFNNPNAYKYIPVVSDSEKNHYLTETHYIRSISTSEFRVWRTSLDTGSRNGTPDSFTAIVAGFW